MTTESPVPPRRPSLVFPEVVLIASMAALVLLWLWKGTRTDYSLKNMLKMGVVIAAVVILLVWTLRKSGLKRTVVFFGGLALFGLPLLIWKPGAMGGGFSPTLVMRDWVKDVFFDGSADTVLERHRAAQGASGIVADLTAKPDDVPAYRGTARDGVMPPQRLVRDWSTPPREVWRQPVGGGYAGFVIANGFLVTIEQRRDQEVVACYEAATGKEVWTRGWKTRFSEALGGDGPRATPTIAHGDVFALGAKGRLVCLNGSDGAEKWSHDLLAGNDNLLWGMSGAPLVVDDLVIVNPGVQSSAAQGTALRAYNRKSGQLVWQAGNQPTGYCSPQLATLGGVKQVLIFDGHGLAGHELVGGKELWRTEWKTMQGINVAQPIVLGPDTVCIAAGYNVGGGVFKIAKNGEKWTATPVWKGKSSVMRWKFSSGVRRKTDAGDFAFGLNDGHLECVDLKSGKAMWKDENRPRVGEGFGFGQIVLSDDLIVGITDKGELVLVEANPESFNELGRVMALPKGPKTWNIPLLAGGRVYVRNEEEMACYDLTGK